MSAETRMEQGKRVLTTPRAAAVAGILAGVLLLAAHLILRFSITDSPPETGASLMEKARALSLISYFVPFAGIFFLWFMGVARDRLGHWEDRFFATIFLGSGLLYLAMIFSASAIGAGAMAIYSSLEPSLGEATYIFARSTLNQTTHLYAVRSSCFHALLRDHVVSNENNAALDGIPDLCAGSGASGAGVFHFLDHPCLSCLDAYGQHPDINHQLSQHFRKQTADAGNTSSGSSLRELVKGITGNLI